MYPKGHKLSADKKDFYHIEGSFVILHRICACKYIESPKGDTSSLRSKHKDVD